MRAPDLAVVLPAPQRDQYVIDSSTALTIAHLGGVQWHACPLPKRRHRCWAQTWGVGENSRVSVMRCACGAVSFDRALSWEGKNQRRSEGREWRRIERRSRRIMKAMRP